MVPRRQNGKILEDLIVDCTFLHLPLIVRLLCFLVLSVLLFRPSLTALNITRARCLLFFYSGTTSMAFQPVDVRFGKSRQPESSSPFPTELPMRPNGRPPTYTSGVGKFGSYGDEDRSYSRRNPKNWSKKCWGIMLAMILTLLIIIIVIAVALRRGGRYPNYSQLSYSLKDTYSGTSFFDNFDYFTGYDPAQGFVHYVDGPGSMAQNLTYASTTSAVLRVQNTDTDSSTGRLSVRIESKSTYDTGLFVFDVVHSPYGCSTWPALWLSDQSNWPTNGEIDIMEATNTATTGNQMTLHTTNGCSMTVKRKETGSSLTTNCYNGTDGNAGCGVKGSPATFGPVFNSNGGGVYATELRSAGIRTWFFPRSSIPSDITSGSPDPSTWGEALADFPNTDCDISSHFRNQSIIANIDICGQWAGTAESFNAQGGCPGTCKDYVTNQPGSVYDDAYWEFASFKVYTAA